MPRTARLAIAGYPMHVVQRGNNRSRCFVDDTDRQLYLGLLAQFAHREQCAIHAYVLMTNHVHLLVTGERNHAVSSMMKGLGECYVKAFNTRHARTGTLWEGRFRSSIVGTDRYFLACQRYIELNPVRAALVVTPGEYAWSSYRANAWGEPSFIQPHGSHLELGKCADRRLLAYRRMFDRPQTAREVDAIRAALKGGFAVGDESFVAALASLAGRPVTMRRRGRKARQEDHEREKTAAVSLFDN